MSDIDAFLRDVVSTLDRKLADPFFCRVHRPEIQRRLARMRDEAQAIGSELNKPGGVNAPVRR